MAQVGIREYHAKKMLAEGLSNFSEGRITYTGKVALVTPDTDFSELAKSHPWLTEEKLVTKPDQLFGKRGKHGLIGLKLDLNEAENWINEKKSQETTIGKASGKLTHFILEPFMPHDKEYYVSIRAERDSDIIAFSYEGGIEVEENWDKVVEIPVGMLDNIDEVDIEGKLTEPENKDTIAGFIRALYKVFSEYNFSFLEINPFAIVDGKIELLDVVGKLDDTGNFESASLWGDIEFPTPFGRGLSEEEQYIKDLDETTGSSLKLTILNPHGRIWTMVAGGGASVIYADTISDLGFGQDLSNYGEYSGDPSTELTKEYAKTMLKLMLKNKTGKVLIIGGGIANFTDVAKTFTGIIQALEEYADQIKEQGIKIFVRRGGPNFREGLQKIKKAADRLGIEMEVYGPETHMTEVVRLATECL